MRQLAALALVAGLLARPATARAAVVDDLAVWLDGDAAAVIRIDAGEVERAADLLRSSGLPGVLQRLMLLSTGSALALGFDPLTEAGWYAGGFDGSAPVLLSVAAIDRKAVDRLAAAPAAATAPVLWRSRAVLRLDDPARAERSLLAIARLVAGGVAVERGSALKLAARVGAGDADAAAAVTALRNAGVFAVATDPSGALILMSRRGNLAVIDHLVSYAGGAVDWRRDRAALLALVARRPGGPGARLGRGAAARLTRAGTVVWIDAVSFTAAWAAWQREETVRLTRSGQLRKGDVWPVSGQCRQVEEMIAAGPFEDVALSATLSGTRSARLLVAVDWTLRASYPLAAAAPIADDRILDPQDLLSSRGAAVAGAVYLGSLAPLRGLPRTKLLADPDNLVLLSAPCGPGTIELIRLLAWPQLLGMLADQLARVHPDAERTLASVRNLGFAVRTASLERRKAVAAVEASIDPAARPLFESWLDLVFGARSQQPAGHRLPARTTWGRGPMRPWLMRVGGRTVIGAGVGDRASQWYLTMARPSRSPRPDLIAELHGRADKLWWQLGPELPELEPGKALWNRLQGFSITLRLGSDTLSAVAEIGIH